MMRATSAACIACPARSAMTCPAAACRSAPGRRSGRAPCAGSIRRQSADRRDSCTVSRLKQTAFSSVAPRISPMLRIWSSSQANPKVRAGAISEA